MEQSNNGEGGEVRNKQPEAGRSKEGVAAVEDSEPRSKHLIEELQSMLAASLRREKLASMCNEVAVVGGDILTTTGTSEEEGGREEDPAHHHQNRYQGMELTTGSGLLTAAEVYDHLIDMQFERLVSENAQLKIRLKMTELKQQHE